MKVEIDIQNPSDKATLAALANAHSISIAEATAGILHGALENHQNTLQNLRLHLAEGEQQASRGEFVTQSINDMLTEFKAEMNGG